MSLSFFQAGGYIIIISSSSSSSSDQVRYKEWERSGSVLDSRLKGRMFEPHRRHCVLSLTKNINPSLVLVQFF